MQPQIQQIPQPQIIPQNPIPMNNIIPQNQVHQIIQSENPNTCEKFSYFLTGSTNIPLGVFTILMSSLFYHIYCTLFFYGFLEFYYQISSFFDFIFALLVWSRIAIKIERNTSTVKYFYLYIINLLIISLFTLSSPLGRIWNFILFETILIALKNKNKKIDFFCCKINGIYMTIFTIVYHLFFNTLNIGSIIFTIVYAFIYKNFLIQRLNISNENVQRKELNCFINFLKNKFKTFVSIEDILVLNQGQINQQPLQQNINNNINYSVNSVNSMNSMINSNGSFIPNNMYPNYYSGIAQNNPNNNQAQIQYQPNANAQPVNEINQASS